MLSFSGKSLRLHSLTLGPWCDMAWYYYMVLAVLIMQMLFLWHCWRNYRYALAKYQRAHAWYPRALMIVPCKGLDPEFQKNISSFFNQDYEGYLLWFVVESTSDPAYQKVCRIRNELRLMSKARDIQVHVAGTAQTCGQKVHNLLYCCKKMPDGVEILAFADSDACVRQDWLRHIVWPLRKSKVGASTGYRWYIPQRNNLATLTLSVLNAKVAQLLGCTPFNQAWGGSMAISVDVFRQMEIDKIWEKAICDDLSLSYAVKKAHKDIAFVPACLVSSYESTTWSKLFEFARRQFLITRVAAPRTWWFGLFCSLYSVLGLYGGAALAVYAALTGAIPFGLFITVPVVFLAGQFIRAGLRQKMAARLLKNDLPKMKAAMVLDLVACWLLSPLLLLLILSSACGRTIVWRGIRYKLCGPAQTVIITDTK